jgi:hypothetical protein
VIHKEYPLLCKKYPKFASLKNFKAGFKKTLSREAYNIAMISNYIRFGETFSITKSHTIRKG